MRTPTLLAVSVAGFLAVPALGQWSATILHPPGAYASEIRALAHGQQAGSLKPSFGEDYHAAMWNGSGPWVDLGLGGGIVGMTSTQQVGSFNGHASLWSGTPGSRVELFNGPSVAYGIAGGQQVGYISPGSENNAALWFGSAASVVNLNPAGAVSSAAQATDGVHQWGAAGYQGPSGFYGRAIRWSGTAATAIDFTPPGAQFAGVRGVGGGQQAGQANFPGVGLHATIWNGTPESWVDLHPFPAFGDSQLFATTGTMQVGSSHVPGFTFPHAGVWSGTAATFIDLNQFLPSGYGGESLATSIIVDGGITYVGGYARGPSGQKEAVLWTLVPAPGSGIVALAWLAAWSGRRRRPR